MISPRSRALLEQSQSGAHSMDEVDPRELALIEEKRDLRLSYEGTATTNNPRVRVPFNLNKKRANPATATTTTTATTTAATQPFIIFDNLIAWSKSVDSAVIKALERDKTHFRYCHEHDVLQERYPVIASNTTDRAAGEDRCGICLTKQRGSRGSVVDLIRASVPVHPSSGLPDVEAARVAYEAAQTVELAARDKRDQLKSEEAMHVALEAEFRECLLRFLAYETVIWELGKRAREQLSEADRSLVARGGPTDTGADDDGIDIEPGLTEEQNVYYSKFRAHAFAKDRRSNTFMYCGQHDAIGDAFPWRPHDRYRPCYICVFPRGPSAVADPEPVLPGEQQQRPPPQRYAAGVSSSSSAGGSGGVSGAAAVWKLE